MAEVPIEVLLREILRRLTELEASVEALEFDVRAIDSRLVTLEAFMARLGLPFSPSPKYGSSLKGFKGKCPTCGKHELREGEICPACGMEAKFPRRSQKFNPRWVLEIFPEEIETWTGFIERLLVEHAPELTKKEESFLRSLRYYITTERKITIPQIAWLYSICKRIGIIIPPVPPPELERR